MRFGALNVRIHPPWVERGLVWFVVKSVLSCLVGGGRTLGIQHRIGPIGRIEKFLFFLFFVRPLAVGARQTAAPAAPRPLILLAKEDIYNKLTSNKK